MIDGGWALEVTRTGLEQALAQIGHSLSDIRRILVTHVHRDHYSEAVSLRREFGCDVWLGTGERSTLDILSNAREGEEIFEPRLRRCGGEGLVERWQAATDASPTNPADWEQPDYWMDGPEHIRIASRSLTAVPTPGHTRGHYVFADEQAGLMFAGDHILPTISPSIGFEAGFTHSALSDYLSSLAVVRSMPDLALLPAHGAVTDSTHKRVDELLHHHDVRLRLSREAVTSTGSTAFDVAHALPWTRRERTFSSLGDLDAALAAMETLAHLELLVARQEIRHTVSMGVDVFYPIQPATPSVRSWDGSLEASPCSLAQAVQPHAP